MYCVPVSMADAELHSVYRESLTSQVYVCYAAIMYVACRADVYDRMTIFEDHMIRDINAGRFKDNTSLVLLTHGLALRVFLMRWFHWTVDQFMNVYNPPNAEVRNLSSFSQVVPYNLGCSQMRKKQSIQQHQKHQPRLPAEEEAANMQIMSDIAGACTV